MGLDHFDLALRGSTSGIWVVCIVLIFGSRISTEAKVAFLAVIATSAGQTWSGLPPSIPIAEDVENVLRYLAAGAAFTSTWFVIVIFLDNRRYHWIWLVLAAALSISVIINQMIPEIIPFQRAYAGLHYLVLAGVILYTGRDDLQDARRIIRPIVATLIAVLCITFAFVSTPMRGADTVESALMNSIPKAIVVIVFAIWALKANLGNWPGKVEPRPASQPDRVETSFAENALAKRINDAMAEGVWQVEGLTVGKLAQQVKAPEHQVRKVINRNMGHRNFASFINSARIDAAKARLQSPEAAEATILEIAFDVGFSSLGPFNRAFREATGQSPTDFRKKRLQVSAS